MTQCENKLQDGKNISHFVRIFIIIRSCKTKHKSKLQYIKVQNILKKKNKKKNTQKVKSKVVLS